MNLPPHETWSVIDSTKLKDFIKCPRCYFFRHVLGWKTDAPSYHLEAGIAWHLGMEHLLRGLQREGNYKEALLSAMLATSTYYDKALPEGVEGAKSKDNLLRALEQYAERYKEDSFKVLAVEVCGTVTVTDTKQMHFRIDAIIEDAFGIWVWDHKTAGRPNNPREQWWSISPQIGTYIYVLNLWCPPEKEPCGAKLNIVILRNPPKLKKDGTPYANSTEGNEFTRIPVRKNDASIQAWLDSTIYYLDQIDAQHAQLLGVDNDRENTMLSFPTNTEGCTFCQYLDFCANWPNPLQRCGEVPIGFTKKYWDPRDKEKEEGVTKVNL